MAERIADIVTMRAKHGVPRPGAGDNYGKVGKILQPVRTVPMDTAVRQAIRDRRCAARGQAFLPATNPGGARCYEQDQTR